MKLRNAQHGTYVRRSQSSNYIISISKNGKYRYYNVNSSGEAVPARAVDGDSSVWSHSDFYYCNISGDLAYVEKENKMSNNVNYIGGEYNVVEVSYDIETEVNVSTYMFKCDIDVKVNEGDIVVVEGKNGMDLVRVIKCYTNCMENAEIVKKAKAWIVDVVNYSRQNARKKATERRAYLVQQLEERKEQVEAINMYALLAEADPEAKKLLEELKGIELPAVKKEETK